jgi:hypothetical protein
MAKSATLSPTQSLIELAPLNIQRLGLDLIGDTPLISHAWSHKAKQEMLHKQMKKAKQAKAAKDPLQDFFDSLYWLTERPVDVTPDDLADHRFGMPSVAFKSAAVDACSSVDGITKVEARQAFHVRGVTPDFVEIQGTPTMREDMVRIGMGTADIRYRGEFKEWRATLELRYNANVLSAEQIVNLFNTAGFSVGIGEWRPQRDGGFGLFHVATEGESR